MDNNGDNNNGKDDKDGDGMDMLNRFLKRGTVPDSPDHPPVPRRIPPTAAELPMSEEAARTAATRELSAYFNAIAHPDNPGLKKLREDPRHILLEAVWKDDLGKYMAQMAMDNFPALNRRWFWQFPGEPKDTSFLTPAHVVRTHLMCVAISRHKADFRAPDSEGRLPLYYIARYCNDAWMIPYLVSAHKVDLRDSGRASNDNNAQTTRGHRYEEPLLRAIRHGNPRAVEGFIRCVPYGFDLNQSRLPLGQTPLMLAVQLAEECAAHYSGHGQGRLELLNRLTIVRELVGEPSVDLNIRDAAGNRAIDYATERAVLGSWDAGTDDRIKNQNRPRPWRDGPAP
jgi:hypothetical protein